MRSGQEGRERERGRKRERESEREKVRERERERRAYQLISRPDCLCFLGEGLLARYGGKSLGASIGYIAFNVGIGSLFGGVKVLFFIIMLKTYAGNFKKAISVVLTAYGLAAFFGPLSSWASIVSTPGGAAETVSFYYFCGAACVAIGIAILFGWDVAVEAHSKRALPEEEGGESSE